MNEREVRLKCLRLALSIAPSVSGAPLILLAERIAQWVMRSTNPASPGDPDAPAPSSPSHGERDAAANASDA